MWKKSTFYFLNFEGFPKPLLFQFQSNLCSNFVLFQVLFPLYFAILVTISTSIPVPDAAPSADPMTGMEMYMGTLMAATLLAKGSIIINILYLINKKLQGYLFGALIHGAIRKSHHYPNYYYGRYGGYGGFSSHGGHHATVVRPQFNNFKLFKKS